MKTEFQSTKILQFVSLIAVCAFNLSSPHAVVSAFGDDSERIVFAIYDGQGDTYTMDPDGSNLTNVTNTPTLSEGYPRWSPDGTKISFHCETDIWIMNRDGSNRTNLTKTPGFHEEHHSWSPDGSEIVYVRRLGLDCRIYVMNAAGTCHNELTSGHSDGPPCWSPDGTRIAFQRSLTPGQPISHRQIHVMNSDGTDVHRIVHTNADDFDPAWSPDGTKILFLSTRGGNVYRSQIYVGDFSIRPDGVPQLLNQTNITNNTYRQGGPRWSPDGSRIVYSRAPYLTHDNDIWIRNADGSGPVQLTNTPGIPDGYPDWAIVPRANRPPVADAGDDKTVYSGSQVILDGSGSSDPDGDPLTYNWYLNGQIIATGVNPAIQLPAGVYVIDLVVNDGIEDSQPDQVGLTIVQTVGIDIYPNRVPNRVFLSRNYTLYVAVLGSASFETTTLDSATVKFGRTGTEAGPVRAPITRDLNSDGFVDAMYGFQTYDCDFQLGDTEGWLIGFTINGGPVEGVDSVLVLP
ncbi:MAG: DPP IV N-terminal domain-containing protein [Planctomycetota bacterium]